MFYGKNQDPFSDPLFQRPLATYSIVAFDPETKECGVAVHSHWFSVGSIVPWAQAEVGAVATQSFVDPSYGPLGLALMQAGRSPQQALNGLLESDPNPEVRQVAMVNAKGKIAVHTGSRCVSSAGHITGEHFSVQANMMVNDQVWPAMKEAYKTAKGDLANRLVTTLEAAEKVGGDIRGKQSAALLVVRGTSSGKPWRDRRFDLRIEDHEEPVEELGRLLRIARAYEHASRGDDLTSEGKISEAKEEYEKASSLAPKIVELSFWQAVSLTSAGKFEEAKPIFAEVFKKESQWREFVKRLPDAGLLPEEKDLIDSITEIGR